jgi:hypothetical protein
MGTSNSLLCPHPDMKVRKIESCGKEYAQFTCAHCGLNCYRESVSDIFFSDNWTSMDTKKEEEWRDLLKTMPIESYSETETGVVCRHSYCSDRIVKENTPILSIAICGDCNMDYRRIMNAGEWAVLEPESRLYKNFWKIKT